MPVVLDTETIRLITLFENLTGAGVRDCIADTENGIVYFVIEEGKIGKAIGKNGSSIRNIENLIKKNVKVFEFSDNIEKFVKNLISQINSVKLKTENGMNVAEVWVSKKDKAIVIGRDGKNLKVYKELLHRNHAINELIIR
ncbi:MAG: NusA-like transcription termination signal-binding factor [Candidatus Aenigmarchaeota archaeon]|nr:NusA-like transcription termination signal-binding factor [Candidatus Aenigmarchaeota archaeon]